MKHMVYGLVLTAVAGLFLTLILTVQGRSVRQNEITQSMDHAMKTAMELYQSNKAEEYIMDGDEFMAGFLENFLVHCNSNSEITVNVIKLDLEKGLFSVEVVENYRHPNGKSGTVSVVRTVIYDKPIESVLSFRKVLDWKDSNGNMADFSQGVYEDKSYYAIDRP